MSFEENMSKMRSVNELRRLKESAGFFIGLAEVAQFDQRWKDVLDKIESKFTQLNEEKQQEVFRLIQNIERQIDLIKYHNKNVEVVDVVQGIETCVRQLEQMLEG